MKVIKELFENKQMIKIKYKIVRYANTKKKKKKKNLSINTSPQYSPGYINTT